MGDKCFYHCESLTSITVPKGITALGNYCFEGCFVLTSITLPEGITSLGNYCFGACYELPSITLPEGVISLGHECFYGCNRLSRISIPSTIKEIGDDIFTYTSEKKRIFVNATTPPDLIHNPDNFIDSNCTLYVPKGTLNKYQNTAPWNSAGTFYEGKPIESINLPADISFIKNDKKALTYSVLRQMRIKNV